VNVLNRLILIILALLLIAIPVGLFLVGFGVISPNTANTYTGYRSALDALGNLSVAAFDTRVRVILGIASGLVAFVALLFLLRELTFGKRVARRAVLEDAPGRETVISARAVRHLAEGAALEAGALSPRASLSSKKGSYDVSCDLNVPSPEGMSATAAKVRENIRQVLEGQQVPVRDVEVTVSGTER
jgi:hypothetical protein